MPDTIQLAIVEDNFVIAKELCLMLSKPPYEIKFCLDSAEDLLQKLAENPVDLVLLDIDLAGHLDGVDIAPKLKNDFQIPFIYLTCKQDPSTLLRVTLTEPQAFLSKPVRESELKAAIEIAMHKHRQEPRLKNTRTENPAPIFVKNKNRLEKLDPDEILWIEAKDIYCSVKTTRGQFVLSHSLKSIEQELEPTKFFRIHRSYIIALDRIEAIEDNSVIIQNQYLPIGKTYRNHLLTHLKII